MKGACVMLNIFICEDDPGQLSHIKECIGNYIMIENFDMNVVCATTAPGGIINYLRENRAAGLYFLDVDLNCETTGIQLAETIRTYDPRGFIVFITADAESLMLTFKYKVEAMDYIVKNAANLDSRICECIRNAHKKYTAKSTPLQNNFVFNPSRDRTVSLDPSKILYFETSTLTPHNIIVYTENSRHEFRGELSQIQKGLDRRFFRCHRSFIVNTEKITEVDASGLKLRLGNDNTVDIAAKHIKDIKKFL